MQDTVAETGQTDRLENFPISFFAMVMGLMGLSLALHAGSVPWPGLARASEAVLWIAVAVFAGIAALYALKALRHPGAVAWEWNHPVRIAFFPAVSISLLLIATGLIASKPAAAHVVWWVGVAGQAVLTLAVVSGWIGHRSFQVGHLTPAWFIPAVGNVIVPVAGVPLGHPEVSWLFFSAGLIFWVILLTLVFNRLVFHDPVPARLFPTLVILIAPPAVAYLAWVQLIGGLDPFARVMLNAAYVFAALVAIQAPQLFRLPFALSFWALSFPIAALAIASFRHGALADSPAHVRIGTAALALLAAVVVGLLWRTARAALRGEICRPE
ncbi:C4-dicarboxylate ABC transporter [Rhodosalinus halophilus]|uniref:C4-dicarboxylate ABC transporter n=1 Tax=Rhodosalinus halophilus TaxID=2259333 RepID=A0A365U9Z0_9RHOB|nr:SLAC1 anion channel family protein [Rhodosalinus halophilus]RBI85064.1 C4-dicarboxylate ABC transporter [Rhodosalinus halophilus]